jgi:hypothetical protein
MEDYYEDIDLLWTPWDILEFLKSFPETVDKIERMTEASSTNIVINVPREENIVMERFSEEMAHVFNSMKTMKICSRYTNCNNH